MSLTRMISDERPAQIRLDIGSCFSALGTAHVPANKCISEEGLVHMQNHFHADGASEPKMIHSTNLLLLWVWSMLVLFLPQKIILIGHQRELYQDKSMCGWINWFPSLVCRAGELLEEEGAGTEMEDWKVGKEINWSHYVAVCYLGLEELQRVRAWFAHEARIWALWNGSSS